MSASGAPRPGWPRPLKLLMPFVLVAVVGLAFWVSTRPPELRGLPEYNFALHVVDENGAPLANARLRTATGVREADEGGVIVVPEVRGAFIGVVEAESFVSAPVTIGPASAFATTTVRLWSSRDGRRFSYNIIGNFMLGSAFGRAQSEASVSSQLEKRFAAIGVLTGAADFTSVNLSTVVSDLGRGDRHPGATSTFNMTPLGLQGLHLLGVDLVTAASNHAHDYLDLGMASTLLSLDASGIASAGLGLTIDNAAAPGRFDLGTNEVAVFSFVIDGGDTTNALLPSAGEAAGGSPRWQSEGRLWGFSQGESRVPLASYVIGDAWRQLRLVEAARPEAATDVWSSLARVFPEAQDWAARRGHGGANLWQGETAAEQIRDAKVRSSALIVHLTDSPLAIIGPSPELRAAAREAIGAGADLVVGHGSYGLRGAERYDGKLIIYGLGDFSFDDDRIASRTSAILHTVWERGELLEARLIPTVLTSNIPLPAVDGRSSDMLLLLNENLQTSTTADLSGKETASGVPALPTVSAVRYLNSAVLVEPSEPPLLGGGAYSLAAGATLTIADTQLVHWGEGVAPASVLAGRVLFAANFESSAVGNGPAGWLRSPGVEVIGREVGDLRLVIERAGSEGRVFARLPGRISPGATAATGGDERAESTAHLELWFDAKRDDQSSQVVEISYGAQTSIGAAAGEGADRSRTVGLDIPSDGDWHEVVVPLFGVLAGRGFDEVTITFVTSGARFEVDNVRVIEWIAPRGRVVGRALTLLWNTGDGTETLQLQTESVPDFLP